MVERNYWALTHPMTVNSHKTSDLISQKWQRNNLQKWQILAYEITIYYKRMFKSMSPQTYVYSLLSQPLRIVLVYTSDLYLTRPHRLTRHWVVVQSATNRERQCNELCVTASYTNNSAQFIYLTLTWYDTWHIVTQQLDTNHAIQQWLCEENTSSWIDTLYYYTHTRQSHLLHIFNNHHPIICTLIQFYLPAMSSHQQYFKL